MLKITTAVLISCATLAACSTSDGPGYKDITCGEYTAKVSADDAVTNGALSIASDYLSNSPIDPKGGADDTAALADQIVARCAGASDATKIWDLRYGVVADFLHAHPEDRI